jgi:hypothetical protein
MLTLPFQLQQPIVVAHHPVLTHHAFFLQPEHFVQLSRRRPSPVIIGWGQRCVRVTPIVFGEIVLVQIRVRLVVVGDPRQPQFLHQSILMRAVGPFHTSFRLWRTGGDNPDAQLRAHPSKLRHRRFSTLSLFGIRRPHVHVFPVGVERQRYSVALDPAPQHARRRPDRFFFREPSQRFGCRVIDHVHQTAARPAFFQPLVKAAVQLH